MKWHLLAKILGAILLLFACNPTSVQSTLASTSASSPSQSMAFTHPCSTPFFFPREVTHLAHMPFALQEIENQPSQLIPLGEEQAKAIAELLKPGNSLCQTPHSSETTGTLEKARQLHQQGKDKEAQILLMTASQKSKSNENWRVTVKERLDFAEAMAEVGGNPQEILSLATQLAQNGIEKELNALSTSLSEGNQSSPIKPDTSGIREVLSLAYDARILGLNTVEAQANRLATQMGEQMLAAELEDFDPCHSDKSAVVRLLNAEGQAYLLGVQGMELDEPFYNQIRGRITKAMNHQFNDLIRKRGLSPSLMVAEEPCNVRGTLEVRIFSVCSQKWTTIGKIEFESEANSVPATLKGQGHISFSEHLLIKDELDCSIEIDSEVSLTGTFRNDQGVERIEFSPSFSSDGTYTIISKTTGVQSSGVYPFNGFGRFVMPWVDGSVFPPSQNNILQYALSYTTGE
ncbi:MULTISPECIES: hypothetical protein [Anaerolinea]|uniref:hypothetical protein n=1 Tax=Anaerolinea TaxID=233189 RepID=UPI0026301A64|nr:hypothetical protein [Anaerolinea thermophila]